MGKKFHPPISCRGVIALLAMISVVPCFAAVGRTAGSFNVSNNGAFNYSIPLFTPPGPNGLQPSIALTYNSNAGPGYLGRGWSLSGEFSSSIRSCWSTYAQDNYSGVADKFCLDGNRLRMQSGAHYGDPGSVYMTEVADFSRITENSVGAYDVSWTVERKDGLIYTYGGTSDSRIATSLGEWKLSEIRDRAGNKIRFTWKAVDSTTHGTTHPVKIEWTQTSAGSGVYVYSMDFTYSAGGNSANSSTYVSKPGISLVYDYDLLTGITVKTSGTVKRKYVLTYDDSPTTVAKRLAHVQECSDSAATDCLAATNITYQGTDVGIQSTGTSVTADNAEYDFDGDGFKDLIYASGTWRVRRGTSSGYASAIDTGVTASYPLRAGKLIEAPGDQLLAESGGTWYVYSWNAGGSFSAVTTGVTVAASATDVVLADVNGDGRDDMVYASGGAPAFNYYASAYLTARLNTATSTTSSFTAAIDTSYLYDSYFPPGFAESQPMYTYWDSFFIYVVPTLSKGGDSDGNGSEELNMSAEWHWCYYDSLYPGYCVSDGSYTANTVAAFDEYMNLTASGIGSVTPGLDWSTTYLTSADFNGDGCDDFIAPSGVALASCVAAGVISADGSYGLIADDSGGTYAGFADWNGDGRDDYFMTYGDELYVRPFVGNTMGSVVDTGISGSCWIARTDGNGDSLDDILFCGQVYNHKGTGVVPDLVATIEDGFGVTATPTYTNIARGHHTPTTGASFPYRDMTGGLRVVSTVTATDGIGATYDTNYQYYGARLNAFGRGFVGFSKIESTDSRNSLVHQQEFERDFPYIGSLKAERVYQPGGSTLISEKILTLASATLDATAYNERNFRYISGITENVKEVGGAKDGLLVTSSTVSNTYDSSTGNLTASTRVVTDEDSSSPTYLNTWTTASTVTFAVDANRTTYWCQGLPTETSVTYSTTVSGESSVTQSKTFLPDYTNCRNDEEHIEPGSSTLTVDTVYGYDGFGNVNSVAVTGRKPDTSNMTTRTTTTSWGTTGQFPVSSTNALSQTTTRTFDSTFGSLLTETDPNSIVVADNTYDTFGRITRSLRADGTGTRTSYAACATYGARTGIRAVAPPASTR